MSESSKRSCGLPQTIWQYRLTTGNGERTLQHKNCRRFASLPKDVGGGAAIYYPNHYAFTKCGNELREVQN